MTFEEWMAREGWTVDAAGNAFSVDGDGNTNYISPDALEIHTANWRAANPVAEVRDPSFWGQAGERRDDIVIGGVPYQQLATWFPNDPDPQKALQDEIALLKSHGVEPVYDERYGWIAPDRGVDARVAAAHPDVAKSSIFEFAPFILGGGLAALAAGFGVAGAGALASEAAPAVGALSDAAIADIVAAEGGFSALPSAGMAGTAPVVTGALPESYWGMTAEAPGSTMTDVIPQAFTAPAPLPPIDPATIPLTAAEQQAAWAKAGLSPIGKSPFITGSALGDSVAKGALAGAGTSAIGGGDVGKGALMGAVTGGATNVISPAVSGLTAYPAVNQAIGNAALSAGTAGLTGGDPVTAVGNSAARSGVNAAGGALWNAASGALDGSTPAPDSDNQAENQAVNDQAGTEGELPNSGDTNMAESNWWGDLTALFADQEGYDSMNAIPSGGGPAQLPAIDQAYANQAIGPLTELSAQDAAGNPISPPASALDTLGLQQMGRDAGLSGPALQQFVASGGTMGSTAAGGGGVGTGAGIPFGPSGGAGGSATGGSASNTININNGGGALGNLPSWALPALVAGLALDNPDRTSTTKVEYPDWYNTGAKSALAQADKFGALGPDSIAPLSGNENEAIQMAKDSTGKWVPQLDKAASTLDESKYFYNKAGALNDAVPGFVNAASGRADAAMPYFGASGALAGSVPGYLDRARGQVDAAMPYFGKAGQTADTVGGYLNRATGQVDAAMPYFSKAAGQVDASMPYFGKAGDMADSVSGYLNKSGALADQAAGGIPSVNLSAYMNPYLDNVLAPIARRNELAKAAALNDIKAKAGMRGAFGGSRSTLLESETAGAADRNLNEAEAGIRANAFNTGLNTAQADLNRMLQASGQYGTLGGVAGNTAGIYGGIGKTVADTGNIYSGVGKNIADTAGTFTTAGNVAGNTANVYGNIGKGIADTAGVFNNSGVVATGAANSLTGTGKGVADTADIFNKSAGALTGAANADTNIGRSLTDASSGYRANAGVFGALTDADIARLMGTGATSRSVDQAKLNAPLTAIGGYAAALRGAGTPGATTTNVAPEASKIGQAATGLGALIGANKAGLI